MNTELLSAHTSNAQRADGEEIFAEFDKHSLESYIRITDCIFNAATAMLAVNISGIACTSLLPGHRP